MFASMAAMLAMEAVVVGMVWHKHLAGPWELRVALVEIAPVGGLAAIPLAMVAAVASALLDESQRRGPRAALAAMVGLASGAVAFGVTHGPHFAQAPVRVSFVGGLALVGAAVAWVAAQRVRAWKSASSPAFAIMLAAAIVVAIAANVFVLPRLYPAFHLALALLALSAGAWLGEIVARLISPRWMGAAAAVLIAACVAGSWLSSRDLARWDNVRLVYHTRAPSLTYAVRLAALLGGPSRQSTQPLAVPVSPRSSDRQWVDWRGRDLLLITIDALRADHVGAYGYERPTTPSIDMLAKDGVVFDRAYCAMPHTSYSITSLMTGKYIRPLVLQGAGADSDTFAGLMRLYGYRTAAFYPPSLFVVDHGVLMWAEDKGLDFEYRKVEYATADHRVTQVQRYLDTVAGDHKLLLWVHLFEPHEPYERHADHDFGERDVDRYDAEIATADQAVGRLVALVREKRPGTVVVLAADHGEEFGDHGGYYHGTTVFEEQVRVPLVVNAAGLVPRKVEQPVQLIDVLPTVLNALGVPRTPRLRGNDLGGWLMGQGRGEGEAFVESYDQVLLAQGPWRLVCERKVDACSLYDLRSDAGQGRDLAPEQADQSAAMRRRLRDIEATHGAYELSGARMEGKALPPALVRGIAGDVNAAKEVAALLDDADVALRRKAAQVLFELASMESAAALSLALTRDEDEEVRRWCALALTRMGQGAPLALELLDSGEQRWRRMAALAFADAGDPRGEAVLVDWWNAGGLPFDRSRDLVRAFAKIRSKAAVVALTKSLDDVNLRPHIAAALAKIGDPYGKIKLASRFGEERYENSRQAIAQALVDLGATTELVPGLCRFLGVHDPMPNGVQIAVAAHITGALGGPDERLLEQVRRCGPEGIRVPIVVPRGGNGKGFRVVIRARSRDGKPGVVRVAIAKRSARVKGSAPESLTRDDTVSVRVTGEGWAEVAAPLPASAGLVTSRPAEVVLAPDANVAVDAFVVVPLADEIAPPPPEPWVGPSDDDAPAAPAH
jgi:arylsulfatase A-like enzyme